MKHYLSIFLRVFFVAFLFSMLSSCNSYLFRNGRSAYSIVIGPDASVSERTAAEEFRHYIREISGADLPITDNQKCRGKRIFIGFSPAVAGNTGIEKPEDDDESFTYKNVRDDIYIYGGSRRGTMYGVYTFLERELGCRWYTPVFTKIPSLSQWSFKDLDHSETPSVRYRYSNYCDVTGTPAWSAHNKENTKWVPSSNEYGGLEAYWSCHTFGYFIPESEFFESHPEYFALKKGKRIRNGQLCLSNPEVLEICIRRLAQVMESEPLYRIYSLSQNDNFGFCECEECKKIEEQYGGHSGLILWFVNQAADAVKDLYPDKYVGTFAYQYGRKPPVGISPRENVVIRLCNIECCFAHPLEAGCPQNKEFMADLDGWKKIAPHLFIWDYIVDYAQYLAPFPNFSVLGPNIRTFRDNNAIGIFEEAQYQSGGSEFSELRTWVVTKLLWDPEQDADTLAKDFIYGYYGEAAPKIWEYYLLSQSQVTPDTHFSIYMKAEDPFFKDEFIHQSEVLLGDAIDMAESDLIREHVLKVRMQILYLKLMRNRQESLHDGTWDELKASMIRFGARPSEPKTLEEFIAEIDGSAGF